jgi:hypothetical protein
LVVIWNLIGLTPFFSPRRTVRRSFFLNSSFALASFPGSSSIVTGLNDQLGSFVFRFRARRPLTLTEH